MPSTAETMPAIRSDVSGLSNALAASRLAARGKAANSSPSITSTRPIATMNWAISASRPRSERPLFRGAARWGRGPGRCGAFAHLARRVDEVAEELRIRLEQHARIVGAHPRLVGLHRAVEREEVGIPTIGLGENAVTLAVALAAGLLTFRLRVGEQHGDLAIGLGADLLRALGALRAQLRRLLLALGLHALIDRLAVLLRQVGAANAH